MPHIKEGVVHAPVSQSGAAAEPIIPLFANGPARSIKAKSVDFDEWVKIVGDKVHINDTVSCLFLILKPALSI